MGYWLGSPQPSDQGDHLVRATPAFLHGDLHRRKLLRVFAADTNAEDHSSVGDTVEIGDLLGHEGGRIERQQQN